MRPFHVQTSLVPRPASPSVGLRAGLPSSTSQRRASARAQCFLSVRWPSMPECTASWRPQRGCTQALSAARGRRRRAAAASGPPTAAPFPPPAHPSSLPGLCHTRRPHVLQLPGAHVAPRRSRRPSRGASAAAAPASCGHRSGPGRRSRHACLPAAAALAAQPDACGRGSARRHPGARLPTVCTHEPWQQQGGRRVRGRWRALRHAPSRQEVLRTCCVARRLHCHPPFASRSHSGAAAPQPPPPSAQAAEASAAPPVGSGFVLQTAAVRPLEAAAAEHGSINGASTASLDEEAAPAAAPAAGQAPGTPPAAERQQGGVGRQNRC